MFDLSKPFTEKQKQDSFIELQEYMLQSRPFFVGRVSGNEPNLAGLNQNGQMIPAGLLHQMLFGAGIQFKTQENVDEYVKLYTKACCACPMIGVWDQGMYFQAKPFYDILKDQPQKQICAYSLEPYYFMDHPQYRFDKVFENKKVLIITSHSQTTAEQLKKSISFYHKPIFHNSTEFFVYKPAQQNGGNHDDYSWDYHFQKMKKELADIKRNQFDYDIAFVSCGGFGMILSNYLYEELNVSVIYVGGALQLFFGIMGNRWKTNSTVLHAFNPHWTSVKEEDKPKNPHLCENGCYW